MQAEVKPTVELPPFAVLERVVALSRTMLTLAQADDWNDVMQLAQQRTDLLDALHDVLRDVTWENEQIETVRAYLQETIAIDQQLRDRAVEQRDDLGDSLGEIRLGRRARSAYDRNR